MKDIDKVLSDIVAGKIVIVIDDSTRENEGDFVQAARSVTPESINFMITHGRGLVCQAISNAYAQKLQLSAQVSDNTALHETAFTVSVDYIHGTTTGISAHDRAKTIQAIESLDTLPSDLARPGHIFPIVAQEGGVLIRRGHTEAAVDLIKHANMGNTAVICEILNTEGRTANREELQNIAKKHLLNIVHIVDLVEYLKS